MRSIFLENFCDNNLWKKFIKEFKNTAVSAEKNIDKKDSSFLNSLATDESIWPFVVGGVFDSFKVMLLVITSTTDRAYQLADEINSITQGIKIFNYPSLGNGVYLRNKAINFDNLNKRLGVIRNIIEYKKDKPFIIFAASSSLLNSIPASRINSFNLTNIYTGKDYSRDELISRLADSGYERVHKVYDKGEFSVRGDVIDIFDITQGNPIRISFTYDNVDRLFFYNNVDQNPVKYIRRFSIFPNLNPWEVVKVNSMVKDNNNFGQKMLNFIDILKIYVKNFGIIICDPLEVYLKIKSDIDIVEKALSSDNGKLAARNIKIIKSHIAKRDFLESSDSCLKLNLVSPGSEVKDNNTFIFSNIIRQKKSSGNSVIFIKNLKKDLKSGKSIIISISNKKRIEKVKEILLENSISYNSLKNKSFIDLGGKFTAKGVDFNKLKPEIVNIYNGKLYRGFETDSFSLYGELDIYEQIEQLFDDKKITLDREISDFSPGDYVIHKTHGLGIYIEIISKQIKGYKREYFLVEYANNDKLYIPTWNADRIHKYIGDREPKVTALDSRQWDNLKKKVRKSVHKLAINLARLYAGRKSRVGFAFSPDSSWQKEIEDLFPFRETDDQVKAIDYVKSAMQEPRPMDILVCGDVGFGKTEVAIRAAFKAIENSKQVLMLVPTTILASQHYQTFYERYKDYPVILELISRFKTQKEQKRIAQDFKLGRIDMLIGTHRILSGDIKPKDLGLLIIDEEQRFGVQSKEKLKMLKKEVDVLTLSATPIPRTLYMTLTGIRDVVLIGTYPEGRHPIETFVGEKDDALIKMAIERELERNGQVYYIYNRIVGIDEKKYNLSQLLPEARIALTHGQMESKKIERVMQNFINKEYDILITTSIIESGMDISNVNTLIVENSHKFGLSQLYQLRGRVGRSSEKAYAYLFYSSKKSLNLTAFKRLRTLAEYTDLGSGYNIAMRDLEIRGAGEILGPRQHGHINSVGFEMYCQIMKEEIEKLKGKTVEEDINIKIELPVSVYIPKNYIRHERDRVNIYKNLGNAKSTEEIDRLHKSLNERYGELPFVTKNLLILAKIKYLLRKARIEKLSFIAGRGIIFKKIIMTEENAVRMNKRDRNLFYKPRYKEVLIKNVEDNFKLDLVLSKLNDIINFI
ncbi:MAG: transcription-repair coupling factor [Actinobacteria bacterium]|nr:transcription-repair coupling factor [Actinomycetota bacterium]